MVEKNAWEIHMVLVKSATFIMAAYGILLPLLAEQHAVHKILAREVVRVDAFNLRSDALICRGLAVEAANGYLASGTHQSAMNFCHTELKKRITFPYGNCPLNPTVEYCRQEIESKR